MTRKIKVWVEVFTVRPMSEFLIDVPEDWDTMTERERDDYMFACFEDQRNELVSGGYELVED